MTPGSFVRRALGDRVFARVVDVYRSIFVNLDEVAACVPVLPPDAEILDVGGGDGALLEHILRRQPHVRASLVDVSARVGLSLRPATRARVRMFPSTRVAECTVRGVPPPDAVVLADVLHHVPVADREALLRDLAAFAGASLSLLVVKEIAPDGWRARLSLLSDRYITGDRHVELLAPEEAKRIVSRVFPDLVSRDTPLLDRDRPNYCFVFERSR